MTETIRTYGTAAGGSTVAVSEAGHPEAPAVLLLHGWPEDRTGWHRLMTIAADDPEPRRLVAIDLPGIGGSVDVRTDGTTAAISALLHEIVQSLGLRELTVAGHDIGGMITYDFVRRYADARRAVIVDVVIPGVDPWAKVLANPYIWHFAFHAIPGLPETLVADRQRAYFDFFYDILSPPETNIDDAARDAYAAAYADPAALSAGFDWYRGFRADAESNLAFAEGPATTMPLTYVRGGLTGGNVDDYVAGLNAAGLTDVTGAVVDGAGHFVAEDRPRELWELIR